MRIALIFLSILLLAANAAAATRVVCVASANDLTNALAGLSVSTSDSDADEIRIRIGTYFAPAGGWIGAVSNNHDLTIRGGYLDAGCTQQTSDASLTALDGNNSAGVLTINALLIPNSNIEISGLTFQHGNAGATFQSSAGGLKVGDPGPIAGGSILIERNIFQHNVGVAGAIAGPLAVGGLLAATDGQSLVVRDNLFADNSSPNSAAAYLFSNNEIDVGNNTFAGNHSTDATQQPRVIMDFFTLTGLVLSNNIYWDNSTGGDVFDIDMSGQTRKTMLIHNDIETATGTPVSSTGPLQVKPSFVGAADFHLSPLSPLIDAGVNDPAGGTASVDLDGAPRIDGPTVDLGAYESSYLFVDGFD